MLNWTHFALCVACLILYTGVGFLARPTRGPLLWVFALATATIGSALTVMSVGTARAWTSPIGAIIMVSAALLVWSGLRADRGVPTWWWAAPCLVVAGGGAVTVGMLVAPASVVMVTALAFIVSAMVSIAVGVELVRRTPRDMPASLPLLIVSALGLPMAILVTMSLMIEDLSEAGVVARVPVFVSVYVACYLLGTLVTLLCFTRAPRAVARGASDPLDTALTVVQQRLDRARLRGETGWRVVVVGLDSAELLRASFGPGAEAAAAGAVAEAVTREFPASADVVSGASHQTVVVTPEPDHVIRERVRRVLADVGAPEVLAGVTVSASAGWATVVEGDASALVAYTEATAAMEHAQAAGGDSWQRASSMRTHEV